MPHGLFTEAFVDEKLGKVIVKGESEENLGANAEILVAVIDVKNAARRVQAEASDVGARDWTAELDLNPEGSPDKPFQKCEEVYVVGTAFVPTSDHGRFVWGEKRELGFLASS